MRPILRAESLTKKYGDITAVDDISFEIYPGEIFGFLGPNGAGKTTTIKIMCGLLKPDGGQVRITARNNGRSIGLCPQHIVIWENLTCLEQILYMGHMYNLSLSQAKTKGEQLMNSLGLELVKNRLAKNLSGGMQRRLNIALSLIHSPQVLFLDEPQAGLDPQSRLLVRDYIRSIKDKTTVVLTTHDMEEAEKLSDRICIIDKGKLLASGTADEIKKDFGQEDIIEFEIDGKISDELISYFTGELNTVVVVSDNRISLAVKDPERILEKLINILRLQDLKVKDLRLREKSLEDIFINITGRRLRE